MRGVTPAKALKALRLRAGLTQRELGERANVERSWLNQMERGRRPLTPAPRARLAAVLADALGLDPTTVAVELGGGEQEAPEAYQGLYGRLAALEAAVVESAQPVEHLSGRVAHLAAQVELLAERVRALEAQARAAPASR